MQQSVIGSCTNGRIDDMRAVAAILKGRKVHPSVRTIVIPATQEVYLQCIEEGLTKIFIQAGAIVSTPTCGPCLGGHMGILAHGERSVSTTNRNFVGGHGTYHFGDLSGKSGRCGGECGRRLYLRADELK